MVIAGALDAQGKAAGTELAQAGDEYGKGRPQCCLIYMAGGCRQVWECVEWLQLLRSVWSKGGKKQPQARVRAILPQKS